MSIARILSELVLETKNEDIPHSSYDAATMMFLDTLACAYAGMRAPGMAELIGLEKELSAEGHGTVLFHPVKLTFPSAAYCNSAMIHALDFDNNYPYADIHILSIVVPVALACSESRKHSGRDCLSAIILGVEAAARIAKPYIKSNRAHHYFLTTSLVGGWGGVATAARLLGLSVNETVNAMGIYYAHTCGNRQALLEKKLTKRMQPAIAAKAALYSVLLAQKGFDGPEHTFEGKGGFYRCYTQDPPPEEEDFRRPADPFGIEELMVKQFPTCGQHHVNIISALHLKRQHDISYEDISGAEFYLREGGNTLVSMPFSMEGVNPQIAAQFCAPYAIALALNHGEVHVRHFRNEAIVRDHKTIDLAKRIVEREHFEDMRLEKYPVKEQGYKYTKVILRDGRVLEHGSSNNEVVNIPMDMSGVKEKFRQCFSLHGRQESADQIIGAVEGLREMDDAGEFLSLYVE